MFASSLLISRLFHFQNAFLTLPPALLFCTFSFFYAKCATTTGNRPREHFPRACISRSNRKGKRRETFSFSKCIWQFGICVVVSPKFHFMLLQQFFHCTSSLLQVVSCVLTCSVTFTPFPKLPTIST